MSILYLQLASNTFLYLFSLFGLVINRRSILITIMCIELILLSINLNFIFFSLYLDDIYGQIFSLMLLTVAASESSIGLAIIIAYNRIRGSIFINQDDTLNY
jgi:NADH-quinone oxidoreductase subunit K